MSQISQKRIFNIAILGPRNSGKTVLVTGLMYSINNALSTSSKIYSGKFLKTSKEKQVKNSIPKELKEGVIDEEFLSKDFYYNNFEYLFEKQSFSHIQGTSDNWNLVMHVQSDFFDKYVIFYDIPGGHFSDNEKWEQEVYGIRARMQLCNAAILVIDSLRLIEENTEYLRELQVFLDAIEELYTHKKSALPVAILFTKADDPRVKDVSIKTLQEKMRGIENLIKIKNRKSLGKMQHFFKHSNYLTLKVSAIGELQDGKPPKGKPVQSELFQNLQKTLRFFFEYKQSFLKSKRAVMMIAASIVLVICMGLILIVRDFSKYSQLVSQEEKIQKILNSKSPKIDLLEEVHSFITQRDTSSFFYSINRADNFNKIKNNYNKRIKFLKEEFLQSIRSKCAEKDTELNYTKEHYDSLLLSISNELEKRKKSPNIFSRKQSELYSLQDILKKKSLACQKINSVKEKPFYFFIKKLATLWEHKLARNQLYKIFISKWNEYQNNLIKDKKFISAEDNLNYVSDFLPENTNEANFEEWFEREKQNFENLKKEEAQNLWEQINRLYTEKPNELRSKRGEYENIYLKIDSYFGMGFDKHLAELKQKKYEIGFKIRAYELKINQGKEKKRTLVAKWQRLGKDFQPLSDLAKKEIGVLYEEILDDEFNELKNLNLNQTFFAQYEKLHKFSQPSEQKDLELLLTQKWREAKIKFIAKYKYNECLDLATTIAGHLLKSDGQNSWLEKEKSDIEKRWSDIEKDEWLKTLSLYSEDDSQVTLSSKDYQKWRNVFEDYIEKGFQQHYKEANENINLIMIKEKITSFQEEMNSYKSSEEDTSDKAFRLLQQWKIYENGIVNNQQKYAFIFGDRFAYLQQEACSILHKTLQTIDEFYPFFRKISSATSYCPDLTIDIRMFLLIEKKWDLFTSKVIEDKNYEKAIKYINDAKMMIGSKVNLAGSEATLQLWLEKQSKKLEQKHFEELKQEYLYSSKYDFSAKIQALNYHEKTFGPECINAKKCRQIKQAWKKDLEEEKIQKIRRLVVRNTLYDDVKRQVESSYKDIRKIYPEGPSRNFSIDAQQELSNIRRKTVTNSYNQMYSNVMRYKKEHNYEQAKLQIENFIEQWKYYNEYKEAIPFITGLKSKLKELQKDEFNWRYDKIYNSWNQVSDIDSLKSCLLLCNDFKEKFNDSDVNKLTTYLNKVAYTKPYYITLLSGKHKTNGSWTTANLSVSVESTRNETFKSKEYDSNTPEWNEEITIVWRAFDEIKITVTDTNYTNEDILKKESSNMNSIGIFRNVENDTVKILFGPDFPKKPDLPNRYDKNTKSTWFWK